MWDAPLPLFQGMEARKVRPGVSFYSVHPGAILTNLGRHILPGAETLASMLKRIQLPFGKTVPQGAATTVFCAVSDKAAPGEYHADCNVVATSPHPHFRDMEMASRLLDVSDQLIRAALDKLPAAHT
jgi:hypothetical protein